MRPAVEVFWERKHEYLRILRNIRCQEHARNRWRIGLASVVVAGAVTVVAPRALAAAIGGWLARLGLKLPAPSVHVGV